jgi:hypothetical protein
MNVSVKVSILLTGGRVNRRIALPNRSIKASRLSARFRKCGQESFYDSEYPTGASQKVEFLLSDIIEARPIPPQFRLQRGPFLQRAALSIYPYPDQFRWWIHDCADHVQR